MTFSNTVFRCRIYYFVEKRIILRHGRKVVQIEYVNDYPEMRTNTIPEVCTSDRMRIYKHVH